MAGTSYTRQSTFSDGDTITALLFNAEYNQLLTAFSYASTGTTGHRHDGSAGEGGNIYRIGDQDFKNKIEADSAGNRWTVSVEVGGTATERVHIDVDGLDVTGNINVSGTVDGRDIAADGTKLDGIEASADVTDTTNVTAAGALMDSELTSIASVKALNQGVATTDAPTFAGLTSTGDISLGDNDKIKLGASDDLQIYHDGSNSYIEDAGTGNLRIIAQDFRVVNSANSESLIQADNDGAVRIYYDGVEKLSTTTDGVGVTGRMTATSFGTIRVAATSVAGEGGEVILSGEGSYEDVKIDNYQGTLRFFDPSSPTIVRATLDTDGNLTAEGTLTADGLTVDNNNATVQSSTTTSLNLVGGDGNSKNVVFRDSSNVQQAKISNLGADGMAFFSGSTQAATIDSSANFLVGTTSTSVAGGGHALLTGSVDYMLTGHVAGVAGGNYYHGFAYDGTTIGAIVQSGTTGVAYNTSSDYRLKEDVQPIENATDRLLQLKPCNFAWKVDGSRVDGFLAHEAQDVVPEAVTGTKDAMRVEEYEAEPAVYEDVVIPAVEAVEAEYDDEGNIVVEAVEAQEERTESVLVSEAVMAEREVPDYQGIDQAKLVPLLVATVQEQVNIIQELEARIKTLENAQ